MSGDEKKKKKYIYRKEEEEEEEWRVCRGAKLCYPEGFFIFV
jgi:hypothetical protein